MSDFGQHNSPTPDGFSKEFAEMITQGELGILRCMEISTPDWGEVIEALKERRSFDWFEDRGPDAWDRARKLCKDELQDGMFNELLAQAHPELEAAGYKGGQYTGGLTETGYRLILHNSPESVVIDADWIVQVFPNPCDVIDILQVIEDQTDMQETMDNIKAITTQLLKFNPEVPSDLNFVGRQVGPSLARQAAMLSPKMRIKVYDDLLTTLYGDRYTCVKEGFNKFVKVHM